VYSPHLAAQAAATVYSPHLAAQAAAAAAEGRPGRPVADRLSIAGGCSPHLAAQVTTAAADRPEGPAVAGSMAATDRLSWSMGPAGWPLPLRWELSACQLPVLPDLVVLEAWQKGLPHQLGRATETPWLSYAQW